MNKKQIEAIFETFKENNTKPTTELNFNSNFELLVAVILSAQATDVGVNKATARFFPIANTPEAILEKGEDWLREAIRSIGLYKTKAANVYKTCKILVEKHNSEVPNTRKDLEALPGVGRKTANVVLNTAFGEPTIAVDTHIFRVSNRMNIAPGKTPEQVEKGLMKVIPKPYLQDAHHWLVLHGRYVCIARKPKCTECLVNAFCEFPTKE